MTENHTAYGRPSAEIFEELNQRVHFRAWPWPPDFDPLNSSDSQRAKFGLPPRPDESVAPKLFAAWKTLLSPPLFCIPVRRDADALISVKDVFSIEDDPRATAISRTASLAGPPAAFERSRNWSGGYIRPATAATFTHVTATWVVPNVFPTPPSAPGAPFPDGDYACSVWVGLDGHDPGSLSMPQIGIHHQVICRNNTLTRKVFGWVQWWLKLQPTQYAKINGFTVVAGDTIMAYLTAAPDGKAVNMIIKNLSTGGMEIPVPMAAPAGQTVDGATSEWIVERPTKLCSDEMWTFANYGSVAMNQCVAGLGVDPATGLPGDQTLEYARTIDLVTWDDPQHLGETVSSASVLNTGSVLASYVRS
jgi:hypothetical protein